MEAHLVLCDSCRQACEESRQAVEFLQKHWQTSEETQALIDKAKLEEPGQKAARTLSLSRIAPKVASIAAAIIIFFALGLAFLASNACKHDVTQESGTQDQAVFPKIRITENGAAVSASEIISTDGTQVRELLINSKHRLVINVAV